MDSIYILDSSNPELIISRKESHSYFIKVISQTTQNGQVLTTVFDGALVDIYERFSVDDAFEPYIINQQIFKFSEANTVNNILNVVGYLFDIEAEQFKFVLTGATANTRIILRYK